MAVDTPAAWLDMKDIASLLRTSPKQIANMAARGQMPSPIRVPGLRGPRWTTRVIDEWMRGLMSETRAAPHTVATAQHSKLARAARKDATREGQDKTAKL